MTANILLIEDSPTQARYTGLILEEAGYRVNVASSGLQGLEMIHAFEPDLVILDLILPDLDGFTVCRRIRQTSLQHIPVLILTERSTLDDKVDGLEVGADDYLTKPFEERELLARIGAMLRLQQMLVELQNRLVEDEQKYQVLRRLALTDQLTGLYNRHYLSEILAREYELAHRYETSLICVMVDVDFFHEVNDTYGHPTGDRALRNFARYIQENLRQSDIIARYGGEEFIILLPLTTLEEAYETLERLRKGVFSRKWAGMPDDFQISFSAGISALPDEGIKDQDDLIAQADKALYQAKKAGRNQTRVYGAY